jgi:hypothetical protein
MLRTRSAFKKGEPDWSKLGIEGAAELPAVKFTQINLDKLKKDGRSKLVEQLEAVLGKQS